MIEYGRLMWHYDALAKVTRDAARFLSMEKTISAASENTARTMAVNAASASGIQDLLSSDVKIECAGGCATSPTNVTVRIEYGYSIGGWVPVFGSGVRAVTLKPHTTMPYMG
jgi:Flp pilus assembly protein TadG